MCQSSGKKCKTSYINVRGLTRVFVRALTFPAPLANCVRVSEVGVRALAKCVRPHTPGPGKSVAYSRYGGVEL